MWETTKKITNNLKTKMFNFALVLAKMFKIIDVFVIVADSPKPWIIYAMFD